MIVDALLDLLLAQGAQSLVVESGEPPVLSKSGEPKSLSMPPLDPAMLEEAWVAVTGEAETAAGRTGSVRTHYERGGVRFSVVVTARGTHRRFEFRTPDSEPTSAPAPESAPPPVVTSPPVAPHSDPTAVDGDLMQLLQRAHSEDASDILLSADRPPRLRVGGELIQAGEGTVDEGRIFALLGSAWTQAHAATLATAGSVDLALSHAGIRYRVNVFRQAGGVAAALRPIRTDAPSLAELGLPADFHKLVQYRNGLVLMTGTAGSGKSTTLVALLEHLNRTQAKHVITLEDPIEYAYEPAAAMIHQREVGSHVESFSAGLRAALREAPDVILVGEMRDRDTIAAALTAAETGHLVLSTLHCADAAMAVDRIIDVFPEHQQTQVREQLAGVLRAVVTQVLLPSLQPPRRVVAFERLLVNTAIATKIRERRGHQIRSELYTGQSTGMVPIEVSLAQLVRQGRISPVTAAAYAHEPKLLEEHLRRQP